MYPGDQTGTFSENWTEFFPQFLMVYLGDQENDKAQFSSIRSDCMVFLCRWHTCSCFIWNWCLQVVHISGNIRFIFGLVALKKQSRCTDRFLQAFWPLHCWDQHRKIHILCFLSSSNLYSCGLRCVMNPDELNLINEIQGYCFLLDLTFFELHTFFLFFLMSYLISMQAEAFFSVLILLSGFFS